MLGQRPNGSQDPFGCSFLVEVIGRWVEVRVKRVLVIDNRMC